ncbi:hypothetical protein CSA56_04515 [candidate division KSB3 bacterium]|uniref:Fido domain-containing protein n=1 Tax=candidate division KSB3 bacterium TaxID=2044937 RepID=A0A2G6KI68_9BACT|nr:MAG: hypothetical protein CSA56_04515 [candidate division KSB3 bacterium]
MRTYLETHPWITFQLNLKNASPRLWMLLGESQSKCEHLAGVPLLPDIAQHLHTLFLAKGALATTAIEGNTLTEEQAVKRVQGQLDLPLSKEYLGQEIDNIVSACNDIGKALLEAPPPPLSVEDIQMFNREVLFKLPKEDEVVPGEIRQYEVGVGRYRAAPPEDCTFLLSELCDWLNNTFEGPRDRQVAFGILKAIMAHLYIAWIHPFGDGNGRTARLVEFKILLSAGVPFAAAHLLSNHYNQTRSEYYRQLDQTHKSNGDVLPFIEYALQGFVDSLREQIEMVKAQQFHVHWINYIHEVFKDKDSSTHIRRRRLAIDLLSQQEDVPVSKIRHMTTRMAESYANKTDKTVKRDINELEKLFLIKKTSKGIRVNRDLIRAFLSPTVRNHEA